MSEAWKDRPIDVVIASDLKRSIDTARIIAEPHGLEVVTTPLLRERDWGGFTGRFIPDLHRLCQEDIPRKEGAGCRPRHYQQGRTGSILWQTYERGTTHDECRGAQAGALSLATATHASMSVRTASTM